jgi:hypothetical protein
MSALSSNPAEAVTITKEGAVVKTIKGPVVKLLKAAQVPTHQIEDMIKGGIQVVATDKALKFIKDGTVIASAPMALSVAAAAKASGPYTASDVQLKLLASSINQVLPEVMAVALGSELEPEAKEAKKFFQSKKKIETEKAKYKQNKSGSEWTPEVIADPDAVIPSKPKSGSTAMGGSPVVLAEATRMYQPVKSTSAGSVYFVVGITANDDLKIAARYMGSKLSIRMEGEVQKYKTALIQSGFTSSVGDYVSMHVHPQDKLIASKTLGAVLASLQVPFRTPLPDVSVLYGKGH